MYFRPLPALLLAWCALVSGGCGSSEPAPTSSAPAVASGPRPADPRICERYRKAFCDATGGELSPPCEGMGVLREFLSPRACQVGLDRIAQTRAAYDAPRGACHELRDRICRDLGKDSDSCGLFRKRADNWLVERCTLNLEKYEALLAQLQANEEKLAPLSPADQARVLADARAVQGPPDAPVKIVTFSDFQCPFSAQAARSLAFVRGEFGDQVQVVFRNFPIEFHEYAHVAAQAALAAGAQDRFWAYHDLLFANPHALARPDLERYAGQLGLNMDRFRADLDRGIYRSQVDADLALGRSVVVEGTPTVFVNGRRLEHFREPAAVADAVTRALTR